ncbi:MAG: hypothetical protein RJA48_579 [Verrucomicrobiota bacterium]
MRVLDAIEDEDERVLVQREQSRDIRLIQLPDGFIEVRVAGRSSIGPSHGLAAGQPAAGVEGFGDLDGVERRAFPELVAADPEGQAIVEKRVLT